MKLLKDLVEIISEKKFIFNILWFLTGWLIYILLVSTSGGGLMWVLMLPPSAILSYGLTSLYLRDLPWSLIYLILTMAFLFYAFRNSNW